MSDPALGPLDYVYAPSSDVASDARWFRHWSPAILLTDHLPDDHPVFIHRVEDLEAASATLAGRGWTPDRTLELPMGTCTTFRAPGGLRLAIYELSRPGVVASFEGRRDFQGVPTDSAPSGRRMPFPRRRTGRRS